MSEQQKPKSFMEELDQWTDATVITPLHEAVVNGDGDDCSRAQDTVKKAIRAKVLESYRNGQQAGPRNFKPAQKGGR